MEARRGIKAAGGSGDIGFTAPNRKEKVQKRTDRAAAMGIPDPAFTPSPTEPIRPFGDKPVATGIQEPEVPKPKKSGIKLTRPTADLIPKSFSDFSKKIKDLKVDTDIEKRISGVTKPTAPVKQKQYKAKSSPSPSEMERMRQTDYMGGDMGMGQPGDMDPLKDTGRRPIPKDDKPPVQGPRERGGEIIKRQPDSTSVIVHGSDKPKRKQKSGEEIVRTLPRKNTLPSLRTIDSGPVERIRKTGEVAIQKYAQFAKNNPALGLATYDIGKGIIGKIMKTRIPTVPTPRAIRVSAKS